MSRASQTSSKPRRDRTRWQGIRAILEIKEEKGSEK
ncbi:uncharacterized protein G2W53_018151 [Senna tora]|uniref:Uncharacterized protein n=1 Tax=Senna tora TaxID=362788 RepID=A0A834WL39_9FABA|nr:uncharacterized protein G2W53_018151 [Senna tora]